jgi:hypothetical protein
LIEFSNLLFLNLSRIETKFNPLNLTAMKNLLIVFFVLLAGSAFAQVPKKNGTICREHPYITIVNKSNDLFVKQDWAALTKMYADTAIFYDPTSPKKISLADQKRAGQL